MLEQQSWFSINNLPPQDYKQWIAIRYRVTEDGKEVVKESVGYYSYNFMSFYVFDLCFNTQATAVENPVQWAFIFGYKPEENDPEKKIET